MQLPDALLKLDTVVEVTGLARATIYRKLAEGIFLSRFASVRDALAGVLEP